MPPVQPQWRIHIDSQRWQTQRFFVKRAKPGDEETWINTFIHLKKQSTVSERKLNLLKLPEDDTEIQCFAKLLSHSSFLYIW